MHEWPFLDQPAPVSELIDESSSDEPFASFDGLTRENGTGINNLPTNKMKPSNTTIKDSFLHVFTSPIITMFAMMPYSFWGS